MMKQIAKYSDDNRHRDATIKVNIKKVLKIRELPGHSIIMRTPFISI